MDVFIIRHADAGVRDQDQYPDDRMRPLSPKGRRDMLRVARGMRRLGYTFEKVFDSGYTRARQTSECICRAYELDRALIGTVAELRPEAEPARTAAAMQKLRGFRSVALVGHEPHLSKFVAYLLAGDEPIAMDFKKAGVCRIDLTRWTPRGATLAALFPPKPLRKLGK